MAAVFKVIKDLWAMRAFWMTALVMILLLPVIYEIPETEMSTSAKRCLYVLLVMALLWLTEALPIPVTSLIPLVMFPLTGVMSARDTSATYVSDTSMLFIGGLIVAIAIEECNLHKRIATLVMMCIGSEPKWMMAGLMFTTWFLSMWISNTATASMMMPIAEAVIHQIKAVQEEKYLDNVCSTDPEGGVNVNTIDHNLQSDKDMQNGVFNNASSTDPEGGVNVNTIDHNLQSDKDVQNGVFNNASSTDPEGGVHVYTHDHNLQSSKDMQNPVFKDASSSKEDIPKTEQDVQPQSYALSKKLTGNQDNKKESKSEDSSYVRLCRGFTLCIAYSANIGGIATLTGTPPNLIFKGMADEIYRDAQTKNGTQVIGSPISFANWMLLALPLSTITIVFAWLLLVIFFLSGRGLYTYNKQQAAAIKEAVRGEWKKLGNVSLAEIKVLILFISLVILWISRDPRESPGWTVFFAKKFPALTAIDQHWDHTGVEDLEFRAGAESVAFPNVRNYVTDSTAAMLISLLLFILPAKLPNALCFFSKERSSEPTWTPLLTWEQVNKKLPWGVIILLGGGFALAKGVQNSKLDKWLALKLSGLDNLDSWILNLVLCLIVATITEVTSNSATATLLMPILANMGISLGISPLYLMVSAAISTSFAFMLPVATPPNAIVFTYGYVRVFDMAAVGFFMNIISVAVLTLAVNTWGKSIYSFYQLEPYFQKPSS